MPLLTLKVEKPFEEGCPLQRRHARLLQFRPLAALQRNTKMNYQETPKLPTVKLRAAHLGNDAKELCIEQMRKFGVRARRDQRTGLPRKHPNRHRQRGRQRKRTLYTRLPGQNLKEFVNPLCKPARGRRRGIANQAHSPRSGAQFYSCYEPAHLGFYPRVHGAYVCAQLPVTSVCHKQEMPPASKTNRF